MLQVKLLLVEVLLPALCLVPANVGLVTDIWGVLDLIGTTERWHIYNRLKVSSMLAIRGRFLNRFLITHTFQL